MVQTLQRSLSEAEQLKKAEALLQEGLRGFQSGVEAEDELQIRRRVSEACETAFHSLVVLTDALLLLKNRPIPQSHDSRIEALQDIQRSDLADLYERVYGTLHVSCYYGQRVGRLQEERIRELAQVVQREISKRK